MTRPVRTDPSAAAAMPWGRIQWLVSGELTHGTNVTFGYVEIEAGAKNPLMRHPNCDEILHVLSGRIEHSLGAERFTMEPGDTISIPAGVWHNAHALGDEDAETVICFSSADRETEFEAL